MLYQNMQQQKLNVADAAQLQGLLGLLANQGQAINPVMMQQAQQTPGSELRQGVGNALDWIVQSFRDAAARGQANAAVQGTGQA